MPYAPTGYPAYDSLVTPYTGLSPPKIVGLRLRLRVKNFGLSERSEFPKFSATDRADRPGG
jgi:hypothetical protein